MMKWLFMWGFFCWLGLSWGQATYSDGQEVHYAIAAKLDTTWHSMEVQMEMKYINHSRDTLHEIYFHLWANAYRDRSTTFAGELFKRGETHFYFSAEEDRGGYKRIRVKKGRPSLSLNPTENPDIGHLPLGQQLLPGDTLNLDFSYTLRIPLSFSRLGRTADSYQLTQWYPKPAVYKNGDWVTFPYADQGEFFSEFGRFEVELDAPADFLVAATGRPDPAVEKRLVEVAQSQQYFAAYRDSLQPSEKRLKWTYQAERVHDFALFLDRNFRVDHEVQALDGGREVDVWAFYTPRQAKLWKNATQYLARALVFFSDEIGTYPYPQFTAVEGALSSGAGMEYPMITVIGESDGARELDRVLAHELGHNWWYGILASNERAEPWIDEGLTSLYEKLYMEKQYATPTLTLDRYWKEKNWTFEDAICSHQYRQKRWQSPGNSSETFRPINYFLAHYHWAPKTFMHLRYYLGADRFRAAIWRFYKKYAFSHINGELLRQFLENAWGEDLDWLFLQGVDQGKLPDYELLPPIYEGDSLSFEIRNASPVAAPLSIGFFTLDSLHIMDWMPGFTGRRTARLRVPKSAEALVINPQKNLIESDFSDNIQPIVNSTFPFRKWKIGLLTGSKSEHRKSIFLSPTLRYTTYDHLSIGLLIHNLSIPNSSFQFYATPTINPLSGAFSSTTRLRYSVPLLRETYKSIHLQFGVDGRYLPYDEADESTLRYFRWSPYLQWDYELSRYRHRLEIRTHHIQLDEARPMPSLGDNYVLPELYYQGQWSHPLRRYRWESWTTFLPDHIRLGGKFSFRQAYRENAYVSARIYGGWIPKNHESVPREARLQAGRFSGVDDFRFAESWIGRSAPAGRGLAGLQSSQREGTLKSPFRPDFDISFLSTAEFRIDAPWKWLPLAIYADLGYVRGTDVYSGERLDESWLFSPGLSLSFFDRGLEIHLPLGFLDSELIEQHRPSAYDNWSWPVYVNFSFQWDMDLFLELDEQLLSQ
jgi:hypothetical protein